MYPPCSLSSAELFFLRTTPKGRRQGRSPSDDGSGDAGLAGSRARQLRGAKLPKPERFQADPERRRPLVTSGSEETPAMPRAVPESERARLKWVLCGRRRGTRSQRAPGLRPPFPSGRLERVKSLPRVVAGGERLMMLVRVRTVCQATS